jgi:iron complex outermembrane receptor protein
MKSPATPRRRSARTSPRVHPVAAACSLLLAVGAVQAQQSSQPAQLGAVVVTGIRAGLETSVNIKRNSDSIVEAISAEDLGKLPDISIADSLARLPGLTAQRVDGRAQVIQIRGLSPNYAGTLLNGREIVSTSDSRSAEFDQFPAELLGGATVYKTPDAGLIGQGLAGTVDMQTIRPLSYKGRQVALNARAERNANGQVTPGPGSNGMRLSAAYIDQSADRKLGVAIGFAHLDSPGQEQHYKSWWWADTGAWGRPVVGAPAGGAITLNGFEATATASKQTRDGLMAVVEYKPNENLHTVADLYYSKFEQKRAYRGLMSNLGPTWNDATEPAYSNTTVSTVNGDKVLTKATIGNLMPVHLSQYNTRDDEILALGLNNKLKLGEWVATADLSYSRAERSEQFLELSAGAGAPSSLSIDVATGNGISQVKPAFNFASTSLLLSDPGGWGRDGRGNTPKATDDIGALRLAAKRDLSGLFFSNVEAGVHYSDRSKDVTFTEYYANLKNNRTPVAVPSSLLLAPTDLGFAGIGPIVSYDVMGALNSLYTTQVVSQNQTQARNYGINEKITTGYVKAGIDTKLLGLPVRGNLGVQLVHTAQHSDGYAWDNVNKKSIPIGGGKDYNDVLPSLNLVGELNPSTFVRFGLAKTMARPRMEDMRAGFTDISVDTTTKTWSGSGGNPWLEPWRADSVDLSVEKYFGKRSYVSVAAFHKNLKNFIYKKTVQYDFSGFPNPTSVTPISNIGNLSAPANGQGGMVAGMEVAAALEGGLLTPMLDGFGVIVSGSNTRSNLHEDNNTSNGLDGLSGQVTSLQVYYEKHGWTARISQRHRSAFEATTRGIFYSPVTSRINGETVVDLQLGYAFETGPMKGLSVLLQVNNVTDEPYTTRVGVSSGSATPGSTLPERYTTYGRQYLLGVNYKF